MAPINYHKDSNVVIKLIERVRTKKRSLKGKECQYRLIALLKSTEEKLLWDLEKLSKRGNKDKVEFSVSEREIEGKSKTGGNEDILSLNSFFEKLYK